MTGQQITTPAELGALPVASVVLDKHGTAWQRASETYGPRGDVPIWRAAEAARAALGTQLVANAAPLTVLYRPDQPGCEATQPTEEMAYRAFCEARKGAPLAEGEFELIYSRVEAAWIRAVLALIPPQRCAPTEEEIVREMRRHRQVAPVSDDDLRWTCSCGGWHGGDFDVHCLKAARSALYASQPTIREVEERVRAEERER